GLGVCRPAGDGSGDHRRLLLAPWHGGRGAVRRDRRWRGSVLAGVHLDQAPRTGFGGVGPRGLGHAVCHREPGDPPPAGQGRTVPGPPRRRIAATPGGLNPGTSRWSAPYGLVLRRL